MQRKAFTWLEFVIVMVFLAILAAVLFPFFGSRRGSEPSNRVCASNLKYIGLSIKQYGQDYDEKYPLVNAGKQGWVDGIKPYLKDDRRYQCPHEPLGSAPGTTDYFYNTRLSGLPEAKLSYMASTIMSGDGAGDSPPNANIGQLPTSWRVNINSPARRHMDKYNYEKAAPNMKWKYTNFAFYVYADGHMKPLQPANVTTNPPTANTSTFAPW